MGRSIKSKQVTMVRWLTTFAIMLMGFTATSRAGEVFVQNDSEQTLIVREVRILARTMRIAEPVRLYAKESLRLMDIGTTPRLLLVYNGQQTAAPKERLEIPITTAPVEVRLKTRTPSVCEIKHARSEPITIKPR
ncbi:hypothetical protein [Tuwongella immobilis]|uniref:Uncharacterized protein n=1 Tax=Tuwongella immobilis TaxID=692036 RepID=A0A6C2YRY4_9BACT|nr:hypothetical protein [Tuwongella immobilis]VIP03642.1 unnamed protein product [Tuwongella immobilis]VTS04652.1 unnamed protein product [Tuwongella immobilis]